MNGSTVLMVFLYIACIFINFEAILMHGEINSLHLISCLVYISAWILFIYFSKDEKSIRFSLICGILTFTVSCLLTLSNIPGFNQILNSTIFIYPIFILTTVFISPLTFIIQKFLGYAPIIIISLLWIYVCNRKLKRAK